jgi:hypothetical protein
MRVLFPGNAGWIGSLFVSSSPNREHRVVGFMVFLLGWLMRQGEWLLVIFVFGCREVARRRLVGIEKACHCFKVLKGIFFLPP